MTATFESFPFESGEGSFISETRWTEFFKWMRTDGILSENTVLPIDGGLFVEPSSTSIGTQIQVLDGEAFIKGFYFRQTEGPHEIGIQANESGNPRIDLLVLRADKPGDNVYYEVMVGTPDAVPVAPLPIQNDTIWDLPLAEIYVADGAEEIFSGDITDLRVRSMQGDGGSSAVTLDSAGGTETLVADAVGPDLETKGLDAGTGIALTSDSASIEIASTVDLTSAGGDETLVAGSSLAPNLITKGLTAGGGIELTSDADSVTITRKTDAVCILGKDANTNFTTASAIFLTWDIERDNPSGMYIPAQNTRITVAENGVYKVNVFLRCNSTSSATGPITLILYANDGSSNQLIAQDSKVINYQSPSLSAISVSSTVRCSAGNYFIVHFINYTGVTVTSYGASHFGTVYQFPRFSAIKISD